MTKKGTPTYKRAARAEKAREEWRGKAIERREKAEELKRTVKRKEDRIAELLKQNEQLERELRQRDEAVKDLQGELESQKKKPVDLGERPFGHRFYAGVIRIALELYAYGSMGCRKVARALEVVLPQLGCLAPHHTTVRQWVQRNGCYQLSQPVPQADDWIVLADLTVDVGQMKCLAVVGVRMSTVESKSDMILSHSDINLLGLYPTEQSTGEKFEKVLTEVENKVGSIRAVVIDEGSDVKKGARLYQENHPTIKVLHDIKHKLSLVMKRHLENDPQWSNYTAALAQTRQRVYQTELAALKPPTQRAKARYMDISPLIDWAGRILDAKGNGHLDSIEEERYQQYFGWIEKYVEPLRVWSLMAKSVEMICHETRTYGLSEEVYEYLMEFFIETPLNDREQCFIAESLESVLEEVNKLDTGQNLICSTESLESAFGKYKELNGTTQGVTGNVLGIGAFVGSKRSDEVVKNAMEGCSAKTAGGWFKQKVGETMAGVRRRLLPGNRTKFDETPEAAPQA